MYAFFLLGCALLLGYSSVVAVDHPEDFVNLLAGQCFYTKI